MKRTILASFVTMWLQQLSPQHQMARHTFVAGFYHKSPLLRRSFTTRCRPLISTVTAPTPPSLNNRRRLVSTVEHSKNGIDRLIATTNNLDSFNGERKSVSGTVYEQDGKYPTIKLFTKENCSLCDKVKDVLKSVRNEYPHTLVQVDITDTENADWFDRYKYDIPVLHINDKYWTKHRLSVDDAVTAMDEFKKHGEISKRTGEPNAAKFERN